MASTSKSSPPSSPAPSTLQKFSSGQKHHVVEDDPCTDRCRSKEHGRKMWLIAQGSQDDSEVVALWSKTCLNYSQVRDEFGRTALHAAASNGLLKATEWLVKIQQCNINAKDYISGYTPLHRSIYFGNFQVARSLIKLGADINVRDNEGLTPFELCQMDRPIPFKQNAGDMTELTVWGSNANYNLGLGHQQPRLVPDVLDKFRKEELSLVQVAMGTYQTMFLTQTGKVYACGYGMGGRLGTGNETTVLSPSPVHLKSACKSIAVGQDHTIFLTDGKVWTVGSNEFGQLGQPKECHKLLTPRTVNSLGKFKITGVLASSIHSVFYDQSVVLMCGANQGQFGKQTMVGNKQNVFTPTIVSDRLTLESSQQQQQQGLITTVSGNEYCTAICVENRYLYLLRRYQHARIDSRNTTSQKIEKIEVSGEKDSITLFLLTSSGRVLIWRENFNPATKEHKGAFTRLVFSSNRLLDVKDFSVNQSSIVVITSTGEAYKAGWNYNNPPVIIGTMEERYGQVAATDFQVAVRRRGLRNTEAPAMALELMKIKRIPNVHTGLLVSSDVKGHNFSILQRHQMMDVTDIPYIGGSSMCADIKQLYHTMTEGDGIQDIIFEVKYNRFPAHAFIVSSASPVFSKIIREHMPVSTEEPVVIKVTNAMFGVDPQKHLSLEDGTVFQEMLDMIYTRSSSVTTFEHIAELKSSCFNAEDEQKGNRYADKLKELLKMRQLFRFLELEQEASQLNETIAWMDSNECTHLGPVNVANQAHRLNREDGLTVLADIFLESSDKVVIEAHKCVLVGRVEYFRSMFSTNWSHGLGSSKTKPMSLPFSSKALLSVLDYVYTDKTVVTDGDFDLTWEAIACSDYMMLDRLLQIYECEMTKNINLKNVADILAFSWKHNSSQLMNTCFDFISLNLTAMLENKMLEHLPTEVVKQLGDYYKGVQARNLNYERALQKLDKTGIPIANDYSHALEMTSTEILEQLQVIEETDPALLQKKPVSKPTKSRVRLRSRTLSESESLQDHEEPSKELLLQIDCSIDENKMSTPLGSPAQAAVTPTPGERKYIVPMPRNSLALMSPPAKPESPIKIDEFPSLGAAASSSPPARGFIQASRRTSVESNNSQPTLAQSLSSINLEKPVVAQCSSSSSMTLPKTSTPPQPIKQSPVSSSGGKKKTKWRAIKSDKDILSKSSPVSSSAAGAGGAAVVGPSSSPSSELTSDGRDRNNPWKVKTTKQVTFKDIVDDEVEKRRNFEKAVSKPLRLMQIEDEAINVLTELYTSEDTDEFIELLAVERVVASNVSAPTWVQHAGALGTMKSADPPL